MWRYAAAVVVALTLVFAVNTVSQPQAAAVPGNTSSPPAENRTPPMCIIDMDCGADHVNLTCWKDFIAKDHITYKCENPGEANATCVESVEREVVDWCRPSEKCVAGKAVCQPVVEPEPGPVQSEYCFVECTSDGDCGIPSWGQTYCGRDGSVYQDYVTYGCRNPGTCKSYCSRDRITRRSDYCGPLNPCENGRCTDDADSEPYAYLDGGYYGRKSYLEDLEEQYVCREGEPCTTGGKTYTTCKGSWCYETHVYYSEVDYHPGHLPADR